ncbi:CotS family spore coat protein [Clostridium sp. BL-8]|uniref:CotS family spore coat protein n=1 Tax=Clostridium sp. BL-8 TaxID=349938 RepID=UPI00098C7033|nr:CotS family spore coat protein [Clostridium sp. BL-8]OOM74473.1 spore coat protein I [Clostridium sp. BL-8]
MNKTKYSEKKYLCDYDLSLSFFNEIGIKVNDVVPLRKVFMIYTDEGNKILKKVNYGEDRIKLISDSLDYVKKSYNNVITYKKFKDNLSYKRWGDNIYIVMDILDGREASFTNPVEINLCAENIALMHKASKGLRKYLEVKYNKDFLDISLKDKLKQAYDELLWMKDLVNSYKYKNEFDMLFINNVDKYLLEVKQVQEAIEKSKYDDLRKSGETVCLCHNDLAYHNFLTKNNEVNIIDFDYMTLDLRIIDIWGFIIKCIKNAGFDINKMLTCIDGYEKISILKQEEKELLYILIKFPRDFYVISRDYYYKRKKWDYEVYLNRFETKLNNEEFRYEFIKAYENKFLS